MRGTGPGVGSFVRVAALASALLSALACAEPPSIGTDVAVTIDGERIRYSEFEATLESQLEDVDPAPEVQSQLFDQFLDEQLLIRLAIERGLVEPGVDQRQALDFLLRDDEPRAWSDDEIAAYYEAHRSDFTRPEEVRLRQILVADRAAAETALAEIRGGEPFAEVAARLSEEPRAAMGGDQGRLARDDLPLPFVETIFALAPGEVSEVVAADYGFLIFQVVERFPAETVPLAEAASAIRRELERRRIDEQVESLVAEARERYNVRIFPANFPFEYRGAYAQSEKP